MSCAHTHEKVLLFNIFSIHKKECISKLMNETTLYIKSRDKLILIRLSFTPNINVIDTTKVDYSSIILLQNEQRCIITKMFSNNLNTFCSFRKIQFYNQTNSKLQMLLTLLRKFPAMRTI